MSSFYKTFVALEGPYTICAPGFLQGAKLGKLTADYEPKGGREYAAGTEVYCVGQGPPVVLVYDIFGPEYNQVYQVADHIASAGYMVGVPDFFRGNCWSKAKFPPKPEDKFMDWMKGVSDVEGKIMPDFKNALELLQTRGAKGSKAAVVGFCWGGGMALALGSHPKVAAVACVHPSFKMLAGNGFDAANKLQCPIALLPAAGDDVDVVQKVVQSKRFANKCVQKEFGEMQHGFMAARGDWNDPKVAEQATEGVKTLVKFLKANLK